MDSTVTLDRPAYRLSDLPGLLRIGRTSAYALVRSGAIPSIRVGRRHIIPASSVAAFLSRATEPQS
ncbi:helix-turn-helix domain-containing protein [Deinococcus sp. 23YEL01]|nr:helix-turn-helix domain-containing protein [Deinococcus sp. 23YEL01]